MDLFFCFIAMTMRLEPAVDIGMIRPSFSSSWV